MGTISWLGKHWVVFNKSGEIKPRAGSKFAAIPAGGSMKKLNGGEYFILQQLQKGKSFDRSTTIRWDKNKPDFVDSLKEMGYIETDKKFDIVMTKKGKAELKLADGYMIKASDTKAERERKLGDMGRL